MGKGESRMENGKQRTEGREWRAEKAGKGRMDNTIWRQKNGEWRMVWNILICVYLQLCDMLSVPRQDTSACAFTFVTRSNGVTMVSAVFFFQIYQSVSITCSMSYFDHITKNHWPVLIPILTIIIMRNPQPLLGWFKDIYDYVLSICWSSIGRY